MNLLSEIQRHIRAYLAGNASADDLQESLASYDQEAFDAARRGDEVAERLLGAVAVLLAEYSARDRGATSLEAALLNLVTPAPAAATGIVSVMSGGLSGTSTEAAGRSLTLNVQVPSTPSTSILDPQQTRAGAMFLASN